MSLMFGALALVFSVFSLFCKNKVSILLCQIPANIFYCMSFVFAGAFAPFAGIVVATVRTFVFFIFDLRRLRPNVWALLLFEVLTVAAVALVFRSSLDLLPLLGMLLLTYGMWQQSENVLRLCAVLCSVLFLIYNCVYGLYLGILQEALIIAAGIISFLRFKKDFGYSVLGFDKFG